jgi:hypothetical protein
MPMVPTRLQPTGQDIDPEGFLLIPGIELYFRGHLFLRGHGELHTR